MDGLRWILLLSGLLVVAGVYLYSRRERSRPADGTAISPRAEQPLASGKKEPSINDEADEDSAPDEPVTEESVDQPAPKIVTIRIVASDKKPFPGDELVLSLRGIGMRHGRFGIFHRYEGNDENKVIFSAASLVEPGSFDLENIREQRFPGISLFMMVPGPIDGAEAFDLMIVAARALAKTLNAELLDESGSTLSIQRQRYLREEIIQHQHGFTAS